jgi:hypothetical protein
MTRTYRGSFEIGASERRVRECTSTESVLESRNAVDDWTSSRGAEFLVAIAGIVGMESLEESQHFLSAAGEENHSPVREFAYVSVHRLWAVKSAWEGRMETIPEGYRIAREKVSEVLNKRFPTKTFVWLDGLATAECKVKTRSGVSGVTVSLRGVILLEMLVSAETKGLGEIVAKLPQKHAVPLLRTFIAGGLVIAQGEQLQNALIGINPEFNGKKIVLSENWDPPVAKVKNVSQARMVAARACIVRIMKSAREMSKQQLVERVFKETSSLFQLSIEDIRRCVQLAIAERFIEEIDDTSIRCID